MCKLTFRAKFSLFFSISVLISTTLLAVMVWSGLQAKPAYASESKQSLAPTIAFAARVVGDAKRARLIVDFDRETQHDIYLLDNPKRLVVDLPPTLFSLPKEAKDVPAKLVDELRYGTIGPDQSRIVLDLNAPVRIQRSSIKFVSSENRHRLIVDLVHSDEEQFSASARKDLGTTVTSRGPTKKSAAPNQFRIVVDAGHGGVDGGATGRAKSVEKNITLEFSLGLRAALEQNPAFNVIMTREDDRFVSLEDRVSIARRNKADLLISIHADSLRQTNIRGATIYTLSKRGTDELSRALAKKQNRADLVAGLELPKTDEGVTSILIDLTRKETKAFSTRFANLIVKRMEKDIKLIRNPHRSADFFVLKAPEVPSVLLELGYLSNRDDEILLRSEEWREKAIKRTKQAIEAFFAPRMASQN